MFVVFDLDGTLSDCEHRMHHIRAFDLDCGHAGEVDWDAFYRACVDDAPIVPVISVMNALLCLQVHVEIWTGRSDLVEVETREWLADYCYSSDMPMKMRPHGNHCSDVDLKRGWLHACENRPDLVFEDRARVVKFWREEGIRCCQVATGEF